MIGVETNVLLGLVLNDEPSQAAAARRWFARATATQGVAVDPIVLCERYRAAGAARMVSFDVILAAEPGVTALR